MHDLERDPAVKAGVRGQVNGCHPAAREASLYVVTPVKQVPDKRVRKGSIHRDDSKRGYRPFGVLMIFFQLTIR
jgi:hypothetical protein